jgi:hypothetical protein
VGVEGGCEVKKRWIVSVLCNMEVEADTEEEADKIVERALSLGFNSNMETIVGLDTPVWETEEHKINLDWCPEPLRALVRESGMFLHDHWTEQLSAAVIDGEDADEHWLTDGKFMLRVEGKAEKTARPRVVPVANAHMTSAERAPASGFTRFVAKEVPGEIRMPFPIRRYGIVYAQERYVTFVEAATPDGVWLVPTTNRCAPMLRVVGDSVVAAIMPMDLADEKHQSMLQEVA